MDRPALKILVLPFERQDRAVPTKNESWLFLNAHPLQGAGSWSPGLVCEQAFRPTYLELKQHGLIVEPEIQNVGDFVGALVLTTKSRQLNEVLLARAAGMVSSGGTVLVAGEKTTGIKPLNKWLTRHSIHTEVMSKFHAQLLQFTVTAETSQALAASVAGHNAQAGLFGAGKIDAGSALLASTFDGALSGDIADFCAGTGYLTKKLLEGPNPKSIDLFEADYRALEIAKRDLDSAKTTIQFHWMDLTSERPKNRYDWIVMNPPFHTGRAAEPSLGQAMIRMAARSLRAGGRLRLVANRNLPYENVLTETFGNFHELCTGSGFKVLQARLR